MWYLTRKYLTGYMLNIVPVMMFVGFFVLQELEKGIMVAVVIMCFWTWFLVNSSISKQESYEEKHSGYRFLQSLPVSDREIVAAKFLALLIAVLLIFATSITSVIHKFPQESSSFPATAVLGWAALFSIIFGGVMYAGIFKFGAAKMTNIFWIITLGIVAVLVFGYGFMLDYQIQFPLGKVKSLFTPGVLLAGLIPVLLLYYYLMRTATRAKTSNGEA